MTEDESLTVAQMASTPFMSPFIFSTAPAHKSKNDGKRSSSAYGSMCA